MKDVLGDGKNSIGSSRSHMSETNAEPESNATSAFQFQLHSSEVVNFLTEYFPIFPAFISFTRTTPSVLVLLSLVIYTCQYLSFIINPHYSDVLGPILGGKLATLLYALQFPVYDPMFVSNSSPYVNLALVYVALFIVFIAICLVMSYLYFQRKGEESVPVIALTTMLLFCALSTWMQIPLYQMCLTAMVCGKSHHMWLHPNDEAAECWGDAHIASFTGGLLCMLFFLPLMYITASCYFVNRPLQRYLKSQRHPYVEIVTYFHTVLSCVLWSVLLGFEQRMVFAIIHSITSALVALSYAWFLPYYSMSMNRFFVVVHMLEMFTSVGVAAASGSATFRDSGAVSVVILGAWPFIAVFAVVVTPWRINDRFAFESKRLIAVKAVMGASMSEENPYDGEYDDQFGGKRGGRFSDSTGLATDEDDLAFDSSQWPYPEGLTRSTVTHPFPQMKNQLREVILHRKLNFEKDGLGGDGSERFTIEPLMVPYISRVILATDVDLAVGFIPAFASQFGEKQINPNMFLFALEIYSKGMLTFPVNTQVVQDFASFIVNFVPQLRYVGADLVRASARNDQNTLTQQFVTVRLARDLRKALGIRNHANIIHASRARLLHAKVLAQMNAFWVKLTETSVNIKEVSQTADEIHRSRDNAVKQFRRALKVQSAPNMQLINRLGDFFADVLCDRNAAQECYNEAREIYEAKMARSMRGTKKLTTMELDHDTLTERLMQLLSSRTRQESTGGSSSSSVRLLFFVVSFFCAVLVVMCALFIFTAVDNHDKRKNILDFVYACSELRSSSVRFVSLVIGSISTANTTEAEIMWNEAKSVTETYAVNFLFVSKTVKLLKGRSVYSMFEENTIAYDTETFTTTKYSSDRSVGNSLWTLGSEFLADMETIVGNEDYTSLSAYQQTALNSAVQSIIVTSRAFNMTIPYVVQQSTDEVRQQLYVASALLFVISVAVLAAIACAFYVGFRATAMARVFTFQLFTLIPYDALEKLATDSKQKVHQMSLERSARQRNASKRSVAGESQRSLNESQKRLSSSSLNPEEQPRSSLADSRSQPYAGSVNLESSPVAARTGHRLTNGTVNGVQPSATVGNLPPLAQTTQRVGSVLSTPAESYISSPRESNRSESRPRRSPSPATQQSSGPALRSCLKPPGSRKRVKKNVTIDPVVQVFGDTAVEDDGGTAGKRKGGKGENGALGDADGGGEVEAMTAMINQSVKKARTPQSDVDRHRDACARIVVVAFYLGIVLMSIASIILLGFALGNMQTSEQLMKDLGVNQLRLIAITSALASVPQSVIGFITTGQVWHLVRFLDYVFEERIRRIPTDPLPVYDTIVLPQIAQLRENSVALRALALDAVAIAARGYDNDLSLFPQFANYTALTTRELEALMIRKYPVAAERSLRYANAYGTSNLTSLGLFIFGCDSLSHILRMSRSSYTFTDEYMSETLRKIYPAKYNRELFAATGLFGAVLFVVIVTYPLFPPHLRVRPLLAIFVVTGFTIPLVFCIALCVISGRPTKIMETEKDIMLLVTSGLRGLKIKDAYVMSFLFSGEAQPWYEAHSIEPRLTLSDLAESLIAVGYASKPVVSLFTGATNSLHLLTHIQNVSCALAMAIVVNRTSVEAEMLQSLDYSTWDVKKEPLNQYFKYWFPADTHVYTNKAEDTAKPADEQYAIAINSYVSARYQANMTLTMSSFNAVGSAVFDGQQKKILSEFHTQEGLAIAALCECVLPIICCMVLGVRVAFLFCSGKAFEEKTGQLGRSFDESRYVSTFLRVVYMLIFIGALLTATLITSLVIMSTRFANLLNVLTLQTFFSGAVLMMLRGYMQSMPMFVSPVTISINLKSMLLALFTFLSEPTSTSTSVGTVLVSDDFLYLFYGSKNYIRHAGIALSYLTDNCSRYFEGSQPLPIEDVDNLRSGLDRPILAAIFEYIHTMMSAWVAVSLTSYTDNVTTLLSPLRGTLRAIEPKLSTALATVTDSLVETSVDVNLQFSKAFIVMASVSTLSVVLLYVCVVLPVIKRLYREEDAARMLLQMIPLEVRSQVPAISQFIETGRITNAAALQRKFDASEKLLQNILPNKIAARLKSGEQPVADMHKCVTILFTDFVGFTSRSSTMQAREIVDFLNEVFLEFDTIVELLELEKIKTIGDAFFMVGGLDRRVADHAMRVIEAGLMFFDALAEHNARHPSRVPLQMRLGVHTGPAIAGVIGIKKVAYDLWGDTVVIANAMESTGVSGHVHISEVTAQMVRGFYKLRPCGPLHCSKEHIPESMPPTYLVTGRLLPTPYMHLRRPKMVRSRISTVENEQK